MTSLGVFLRRGAALALGLVALSSLARDPATAQAAQYRVLLCAAGSGALNFGTATNTTSPQNPGGIFVFGGSCPGNSSDPAGSSGFLRISENQNAGNAGVGAFGQIFWDSPAFVHFKTAGAYTRQLDAFNEGWRSRLLGVDFAGNTVQFITQGLNLKNSGGQAKTSNIFGPHVWPFGNQLDFHRFIFELTCVRSTGCDRSGFNSTDANTLVLTMSDDQDARVSLTGTASPFLSGQWVRGAQPITWTSADNGSGIRRERVFVDNAVETDIDYQAGGLCNTGSSGASGEFARAFQPCPSGPVDRNWSLDTAGLSDGSHALAACTQDYGQFQGLSGTGGQTCSSATIRTDNTAPGAPAGLEVTSATPGRYSDHFDAHWSLPPNEGSPIAAIHYEIINSAGALVVPEKVTSGANLSQLSRIAGPSKPGSYRLKLWLEDQVGFSGPATTAPIPHDTMPPAAPQDVSVTVPAMSRSAEGFDVRWRNINDDGSAIDAAHYEVLDAQGAVVVPAQAVLGAGVQAIENLDAPTEGGKFTLRLWLSDAEGNVGAAASVPLAYACPRSQVQTGVRLSAGLGKKGAKGILVQQGTGSVLSGQLQDVQGHDVEGATLCVFSRVVTDVGREFLGTATTDHDGSYLFSVGAGASRELTAAYRPGHREIESAAQIRTVVHPTIEVDKKVVYDKHAVVFSGTIPGPHADGVVVVLQVKEGNGLRAFHRVRTRDGGKFRVGYRFDHRTERFDHPTKFEMRAQVRKTVGYPYVEGDSKTITLVVRPRK